MMTDWRLMWYWVKFWVENNALSIDQLGNTLAFGYADETISSRCGKRITSKKKCKLCRFICKTINMLPGQNKHCIKAIEWDEGDRIQ